MGAWPRGPRGATRLEGGLALVLGLAVTLAARPARADETQQFELAKNRFDKGLYAEAERAFGALLDPKLDACPKAGAPPGPCRLTEPALVERSRELLAAALLATKRPTEAEAQIEALLRASPSYAPDTATLPIELVDRITAVRARLRAELEEATRKKAEELRKKLLDDEERKKREQARVATLERLAGEERVVERRSRAVALLPFGIGQAQNGDTGLALLFGLSQGLAAATSIGLSAGYYAQLLNGPSRIADAKAKGLDEVEVVAAVNAELDDLALANQIAFASFCTLWAAGVVQAQVALVPEKSSTRPRPLPKASQGPTFAPTFGPVRGGAVGGLVGRF
jgi:hypothetical protein